jgi:hypothetical protein
MSNSNLYPFVTKSQLKEKIASSPSFAISCLLVMHARQTAHEQETKSTTVRNRRGFMSSHAVNGSKLAEKVISGAELTEEETAMAQAIVGSYTKQLAAHFRQEAVEANPALAAAATLFSAN